MSERYIQPLRTLIQASFLVFCIIVFVRFFNFIISTKHASPLISRPDAIDAFHPLSGLFSAVSWLRGASITPACPAAMVILLAAVFTAFLLRRSFCSWICPIGTMSEWLWKIGFHYSNRNFALSGALDRWLRLMKYLLFVLLVVQAFSWSITVLDFYVGSPGRALADIRLFSFFRHPSWAILPVSVLIVISVKMRNPFCRYLCPYGALLSIVSLISPVAVQRNRNSCVSCGVCSSVCPSGIDVAKADRVNDPECIGCCRCVSHCRVHSALRMTAFSRMVIPGIIYAILILFVFLGTIHAGKIAGAWKNRISVGDYIGN